MKTILYYFVITLYPKQMWIYTYRTNVVFSKTIRVFI